MGKETTDPSDKWFLREWRKARKLSQEKLAEKFGTSKGYVSSLESGARRFNWDHIAGFARALDISPAELLGTDPSQPSLADHFRSVPLISMVAAGDLTDPDTQLPHDTQTIEIAGLEAGDYFATKVDGESMNRISPNGSTILVNRADREPIKGRRYIFARRGRTTYKRFETNPLRLVPESTAPDQETFFPKDEEEWTVIGRVRMNILDL